MLRRPGSTQPIDLLDALSSQSVNNDSVLREVTPMVRDESLPVSSGKQSRRDMHVAIEDCETLPSGNLRNIRRNELSVYSAVIAA